MGKTLNEFSGHKQQIKKNSGGIGQHYHDQNGCGYENLEIIIIEGIEKRSETKLKGKCPLRKK